MPIGFVGAGIELIEDRKRGLGHATGRVVTLAQEVRFGVIGEAHSLEVGVPGALGDFETLAEVAVGPVVLPQVGVGDAEIHIGRRAAVLVVGGTV